MKPSRISREKAARMLEARAEAIVAQRDPGKAQSHSKRLPTEIELAEAKFASRQLRIAADDIRAGLES